MTQTLLLLLSGGLGPPRQLMRLGQLLQMRLLPEVSSASVQQAFISPGAALHAFADVFVS